MAGHEQQSHQTAESLRQWGGRAAQLDLPPVVGEHTLAETLALVARTAVRAAAPVAREASVVLVGRGSSQTAVFSGRLATQLDERAHRPGFGPSLDAAVHRRTIPVAMAAAPSAYPQFAALALRRGVTHSLSVGLGLDPDVAVSLTLYGMQADLLENGPVTAAEAFAGRAAAVLLNALRYHDALALAGNLEEALSSRAVIEQAKGIIMARTSCTSEEAFASLSQWSQRYGVKVRHLSTRLVELASRGRADDLAGFWS